MSLIIKHVSYEDYGNSQRFFFQFKLLLADSIDICVSTGSRD